MLRIFQQKENFWVNLTSGCHGNAFVRVPSKSTNLARITLLVSMETWSHDSSYNNLINWKGEPFSYIIQKTALSYLNSNQNDSSRFEKPMIQLFMYPLFNPLYLYIKLFIMHFSLCI